MQPIDSIETYVYVTGKDLVSGKEEIKKLIQKMINFDDVTKENISLSEKTNWLFNLISQQPGIDKMYYTLKIHMKQNINS